MIRKSLYGRCGGVVLLAGWLLGLSHSGAAGPGDVPVLKAEPAVVQPAPRDGAGDRQVGVVGACCLPDGSCFEIPALACADSGGVFQGNGTLCTPTLCPPPPPPIICDCPGEMSGDGILNGADIQQFVGCLVAAGGGPPMPGCECADMNGDGLLDVADISNFVGGLLAGAPCPVFTTMSFATSAQVTINMINPPMGPIVLNLDSTATDNTTVRLEAPPYTTGQPFQTELVAMDLVGVDPLLGAIQMQEHPGFPSQGFVDNVIAGPGGEFLGGDSFFGVFVEINLLNLGVTAFNPTPVPVQSLGNTQLPPEVPHTSGPVHVPLTFSDPTMIGEIIEVIHNPEPVCIYEVTCIDGPCNDCGVQLGDVCTGARCPGGTCSVSVQTDCGVSTCCVVYTLVNCTVSAAPACPFGPNFCPICNPTPGACCLPDGTCIVTTEADCKAQGGPGAYQGDGTTCAPPQKCCLPDGSCIDTDPACCALVGGTPLPGLCALAQKCCLADGSCMDTDPDCCTAAGGTPQPGVCGAPEACCFSDGSCINTDSICCALAGGTPDGPGQCLPPEKCCLPDDSCITADPACCVNVLGGTPFPGTCAPVEACCFPDGTCRQLEPDCCLNAGGTPDGVGPCLPLEACCLPDGSCLNADPFCCVSVFGGTPDGPGLCLPPEKCCLPDGSCIDTDPSCCVNVFGGTNFPGVLCAPPEACCLPDGSCINTDPDCCTMAGGLPDGPGLCLPPEACCLLDGSCVDTDPFCCLDALGGVPLGPGSTCTPNPCCTITLEPVGTWANAVLGINRPSPSNTKQFRATVLPATSMVKIKFTLLGTSNEKGTNVNSGAATTLDLTFENQTGFVNPAGTKQVITEDNAANNVAIVTVTSQDYGPFGQIKAEVVEGNCLTPLVSSTINVLGDADNNDIEDAWDTAFPGPGGNNAGTADNDNAPVLSGLAGDWLTRYEEYRGFTVAGAYATTDPATKDWFYRDVDGIGQTGDMTNAIYGGTSLHLLAAGETDANNVINPNRAHSTLHRQKATPVTNSAMTGGVWGLTSTTGGQIPNNVNFCRVWVAKHQQSITSSAAATAAQRFIRVNANGNVGDAAIAWENNGRIGMGDENIDYRDHQYTQGDTTLFAPATAATTVLLTDPVVGSIRAGEIFLIVGAGAGAEQVLATAAFLSGSVQSSTLSAAVGAAAVVLPVVDAWQFAFGNLTNAYVVVGAEQMNLTAVNVAMNQLTVVRGQNGTAAAAHAAGAAVSLPNSFTGVTRGQFGTAAAAHAAGAAVNAARSFYGCTRGVNGTAAAAHGAGTTINYFFSAAQTNAAIRMTFSHEAAHTIDGQHLLPNAMFILKDGLNPGAWDGHGVYHTHSATNIGQFRLRD